MGMREKKERVISRVMNPDPPSPRSFAGFYSLSSSPLMNNEVPGQIQKELLISKNNLSNLHVLSI